MLAIVLAGAAVVGLLAASARSLPPAWLAAAAAVSALGGLLGWRQPAVVRLAAAGCACALAALRVAIWPAPTGDELQGFMGSRVVLAGEVVSAPTMGPRSASFRLAVSAVAPADAPPAARPVSALVEVVAAPDDPPDELQPGDRVVATGRLARPLSPAGFPREQQLRRQGVFAELVFPELSRAGTARSPAPSLAALRAAIQRGLAASLPQPQAALASGLLLGGSSGMSGVFREQLRAAGLGHLVAVDGYKQTVVAGAVAGVAVRLVGRRRGALYLPAVLVGIAAYTLLAGAPASAVRAALMVGAALTASALGRIADPLTSLAVVATAMALAQPTLLADTGFQLSVAATLGLLLLLPRVRRLTRRLPSWLGEQIGITLAVTLATLPVTLAQFRETSLVSPVAHVFAMPLVAPAMVATALLALTLALPLALPLPWLAEPLAWLVWLPTSALAEVVRLAAAVPGASIATGRLAPAGSVALALLLLGWGMAELPESARLRALVARRRPRRGWAALPALATTALAWGLALLTRPDGLLHLSVLGSGNGAAVLLRAPDGATVLVSAAGVDPRGLAALAGDELAVWERSLSAVVLVAPEHEPLVAETLRRYRPATRLVGWQDARLDLGDGTVLDVYADAGPGVALSYGDVWVPISGRPPPPSGARAASLPHPREAAASFASDGTTIWPVTDP